MKTILKTIRDHKTFLVSTHHNPDPDALCSELAFTMFLKSLGKKVHIVNSEKVPQRFHFLPGVEQIKVYVKGMALDYDVAVVLDCGELNRIDCVEKLIDRKKILINIDHHITNDKFGTFNLVDPEASSTGEVLFRLLSEAKCRLTKEIAMNLYMGIMTDTGCFRYDNTTAETHRIAASLMKFDFSSYDLYQRLYETVPLHDLKFLARVIDSFELVLDGKVVCVRLPKKIHAQFSDEFDLRDTIFKFFRMFRGIEVFVILTEVGPKSTRVNLRSSKHYDVAKLANYFGGGGHRKASGCTIPANLKESQSRIIRAIKNNH